MTTKTEALNIAIDYMNEHLEEHDAKYQRHPATESERNNILADIETVKEALASSIIKSYPEKDNWVGLTDEEKKNIFLKWYGKNWAYTDQVQSVMNSVEAKLKEKNTK